MRTTPVTRAEVDIWLSLLHQHGHLHHIEPGPDATWTVQRHPSDQPWTLHHPALAMDWIEQVLRDIRQHHQETDR